MTKENSLDETMKLSHSVSVFSGVVTTCADVVKRLRNTAGIEELTIEKLREEASRQTLKTLFYDGLIESRYPLVKSDKTAHFRQFHNAEVELRNGAMVKVLHIDYRVMSPTMMIFSLTVDNSGLSLGEISKRNFDIRRVNLYDGGARVVPVSPRFRALFETAMSVSADCDDLADMARSLFAGNKMYNYLLVRLPEELDHCFSPDLLYELSAELPIGVIKTPDSPLCPNLDYKDTILKENSIACFNNWQGLVLNDTTCVLMKSTVTHGQYLNWLVDYFEFIYINVFYINAYLVDINKRYQSSKITEDLEREYLEFDRAYNFHNISYNFLPQLIYERLRIGFEINAELMQLKDKISQYSNKEERKDEKRVNLILTILTALTVVSLINDTLQLNETIESWWVKSAMVAGIIAAGAWAIYWIKKK